MWGSLINHFLDPFISLGPKIPALLLGLLFGYLVILFINATVGNAMKVAKIPAALRNITTSLLTVILWIILFSELAREAGLTSLAIKISGSLLIIGLAVANGLSSLANDVVSGIFLAKDRDFEIGYKIKVGDIEGTIKKIDIRKTRLEGKDGKIYIVPNSKIDLVGWIVEETDPKT